MGLSYHFRDKRQFRSKIANFPCVFNSSADEVPHGIIVTDVWVENRGNALTRRWKKFDYMYMRLDTVPESEGQTDKQTEM